MKKVAVILTGELRYLDYCYQWWKKSTDSERYEVTFYSCTWPHLDNVGMTTEFKEKFEHVCSYRTHVAPAITEIFPDVRSAIVYEDVLLDLCDWPHELKRRERRDILYFFGRPYQLVTALKIWHGDILNSDIVIHSRWDAAFRQGSFERLCDATRIHHNFAFRGMCVDMGMVYSCDWAFASPSKLMTDTYGISPKDSIEEHISIWESLYQGNDDYTIANTFLIGHNIFSTYIAKKFKSIEISDHDITLVRKHDYDFNYTDNQWKNLNHMFIEQTTPGNPFKFDPKNPD